MKKIVVVCLLVLMAGCALQRASLPIMYDNAVVSVITDNVLLFPQTQDKEFTKILAARLSDLTKAEIEKRGSLKIKPACGPRTLSVIQEITGITASTVTDVSTGFFVFQLFRGSATSTKSDMIYITTTTSVFDCLNGLLGSYPYQGYGQYPIETLQSIAANSVYYVYEHQRGK